MSDIAHPLFSTMPLFFHEGGFIYVEAGRDLEVDGVRFDSPSMLELDSWCFTSSFLKEIALRAELHFTGKSRLYQIKPIILKYWQHIVNNDPVSYFGLEAAELELLKKPFVKAQLVEKLQTMGITHVQFRN